MHKFGRCLANMASLLLFMLGLYLAWLSYSRAQLPYDEQGNYFDGHMVLHQQAVEVYGLLALLSLTLAGLSRGYRKRKSAP